MIRKSHYLLAVLAAVVVLHVLPAKAYDFSPRDLVASIGKGDRLLLADATAVDTAPAAAPAPAAEPVPGIVSIPWGDWIGALQAALATAIMAAITWILAMLPASIRTFFQTMQVEQLLKRAVDYGVNAAAGATKGKKLDVRVGNAVLAAALQYAVDNAPSLVKKLGETNVAGKILARLDLDETATVVDGEIRPAG